MPAHPEMQLLSRIVRSRCLPEILEWGITHNDFRTPKGWGLFNHLVSFFRDAPTRGAVLGLNTIQLEDPGFELCDDPGMTTEALCKIVRETRIVLEGKHHLSGALEELEVNPGEALTSLRQRLDELIELGTTRNADVSFSDMIQDIVIDYERAENGMSMSHVTWPWPVLNEEMGGLTEDDYVILYGRPKCVPLGTPVLQPDGGFLPIEEATAVVGLSHTTHKLQAQRITGRSEVVTRNIVKIVTRSGHELVVGEDHPILRPDFSYTEAGKLAKDDYIGTVRRLDVGTEKGDPGTYELLGILAGDANYTRNEVVLTNIDKSVLKRVEVLLSGFSCRLRKRHGSAHSYGVVSNPRTKRNPVKQLLQKEGMHGKTSVSKTVPTSLFKQDKQCVAAFLGGLLSTDGGVYNKSLRWNTSSAEMAKQVKHLLLRLGVVGTLSQVTTNIGTRAYLVTVHAAEEQARVLSYMAPYVAHEKKLTQLTQNTKRTKRGKYGDRVPKSPQLQAAIAEAKLLCGGWPKLWKHKYDKSKLFRRSGAVSKRMLRTLATRMGAPHLLRWADSDLYWDTVVSVQTLGPAQCIDVSASGDHNLVIEDVVTHNSMKSWVLSYLIAHFYHTLGLRVLVYTKEMTPKNIYRRIAACIGKLPYQEMRFGKMNKYEKDALLDIRDMAQELKHKDNMWCLSGKDTPGGGSGDTISWLTTKVQKYKPQVVLIDGLYLMSTGKTNQKDNIRVQTISRECRQMVLDTGIPVVATAQANRQAAGHMTANLDEIAYSDAIGQDATAAFRVINEKQTPTIILATAGSREFSMDGFRIHAVPAETFEFHSVITEKELQKAKEKDVDTDDQETEKKKRTPAKKTERDKEREEQEERENSALKEHMDRIARQH